MTRNVITATVVAALLTLAGASLAAPPDHARVDVDSSDPERANLRLAGSRKLTLQHLKPGKLDGIKGYRIYPSSEGPGLALPDLLRKTVAKMACGAAVFGLVELEGKKTFAGKDDVGIFTKYRFRIIDDWRRTPEKPGKTIFLVMHGGELVRGGETYRAENPHAKYQVGEQYVLAAGTAEDEHKTIYDSPPFLEVSDDVIHPAPGWTPFAPGTSVEQAKLAVANAVSQEGCQ